MRTLETPKSKGESIRSTIAQGAGRSEACAPRIAPLRIALYHNCPAGGAKRAIYEFAKGLTALDHKIDVYSPDTAEEYFLPLKDLGLTIYRYDSVPKPRPLKIKPYFLELILETILRIIYRFAFNHLERKIAKDIDRRDYDVVWVEKCLISSSAFILRHLKTPTLYYCQEPFRDAYEKKPSQTVKTDKSNIGVKYKILGLISGILHAKSNN